MPLKRIYHARLVVVKNTGNDNCGIFSPTPSVDSVGQKTSRWTLFVAMAKTSPDGVLFQHNEKLLRLDV